MPKPIPKSPWHVSLADAEEAQRLVVEPSTNEEDDVDVYLTVIHPANSLELGVNADDLGRFCRTLIAVLEEQGLIDEDD